jgi:hypothetical protein
MAEGDDVVCNCVLMLVVQHTSSVQATPLFSHTNNNRFTAYSQRELEIWRFHKHTAAVKSHGLTYKALLLPDSIHERAACYGTTSLTLDSPDRYQTRITGHNSSDNPKKLGIDTCPKAFYRTQV